MLTPGWHHSTAAVIDQKGSVRGTAFFIGSDVAVTCRHVIDAAGAEPKLKPVGSTAILSILEIDWDSDLDVALLRVVSDANRPILHFDFSPTIVGQSVSSHGFPKDHNLTDYPDGFPMDVATITGYTNRIWRGQPVNLLVLGQANVIQGMSGAPVMDPESGSIIGVLRFSEGVSKRALAIPASIAAQRWPTLSNQEAQVVYSTLVETIPASLADTAWKSFDPSRMQCVVLKSEFSVAKKDEDQLDVLLGDLISSIDASAVWQSFRQASGKDDLVSGIGRRVIPEEYSKSAVSVSTFNVLDAFASRKSLDLACRLVIEADLALFDVTNFEPGVMLLLGVRGATRRGITVTSHGGGWREGAPLSRPFNLSDLSISSHTSSDPDLVGEDRRVRRLAQRIRKGFDQSRQQPFYRDLPAYDALRQLGPNDEARTTIPLEQEILFLCSYDASFLPTWLNLRRRLKAALANSGIITEDVVRLQDVPTSQLVSQSLYERIRRCAGCVADWTLSSPSTFFELGVRIAVSPWNVVHILSTEWLDSLKKQTEHFTDQQFELMLQLFKPAEYGGKNDSEIGNIIATRLIDRQNGRAGPADYGLRQVAAEALSNVDQVVPDIVQQLCDEADALNHPERERENVPQALYYEVAAIKTNQERAALERRLAAFLYLDLRIKASSLPPDDPARQTWLETGQLVAAALFDSPIETDQDLALEISEKLI